MADIEQVSFTDEIYNQYAQTAPGEPYRLLPFGTLVKGGKKREITREYAAKFKLPHFRPPIKLGSHEDTTPAGGFITALEVRDDGLYAIPEMTEKGERVWQDGDYRYHSPEIIWENGGMEDPRTGEIVAGPLIVGDALLHTPHLGEAAALYSFEITTRKEHNVMEMVEVPKTLWERFTAWLDKRTADPEPEPPAPVKTEPEPVQVTTTVLTAGIEPEKYEAVQHERDELAAKLAAIEADKARAELLNGIKAELQKPERFGSTYISMDKCEEAAGMMAGMTPEQRDWCMRNFSALTVQVNTSALYGELGSSGAGAQTVDALDAAIKGRMGEKHISYAAAVAELSAEKPEFVAQAMKGEK